MQLVNFLWISLLTAPQAFALDECSGKDFGYKLIDPADPNAYYLCLGILGDMRNNCPEGFHFNEPGQICDKDSQSSGAENEININQNIAVDRPIIFNFFGQLWDSFTIPSFKWPTRTPKPSLTTTPEPIIGSTDSDDEFIASTSDELSNLSTNSDTFQSSDVTDSSESIFEDSTTDSSVSSTESFSSTSEASSSTSDISESTESSTESSSSSSEASSSTSEATESTESSTESSSSSSEASSSTSEAAELSESSTESSSSSSEASSSTSEATESTESSTEISSSSSEASSSTSEATESTESSTESYSSSSEASSSTSEATESTESSTEASFSTSDVTDSTESSTESSSHRPEDNSTTLSPIEEADAFCEVSPNGAFFRDPQSCNRYFVCANGHAISRSCPKDLYFDIELKVCNFPHLVDCVETHQESFSTISLFDDGSYSSIAEDSISTSADFESSNNLNPTKQAILQFGSSAEKNSIGAKPIIGAVQIPLRLQSSDPIQNESDYCRISPNGAFFRDPQSCNRYYVCANGEAISRMCPKNLYFDIKKKVCNFAQLVDCSESYTPNLLLDSRPKDGKLNVNPNKLNSKIQSILQIGAFAEELDGSSKNSADKKPIKGGVQVPQKQQSSGPIIKDSSASEISSVNFESSSTSGVKSNNLKSKDQQSIQIGTFGLKLDGNSESLIGKKPIIGAAQIPKKQQSSNSKIESSSSSSKTANSTSKVSITTSEVSKTSATSLTGVKSNNMNQKDKQTLKIESNAGKLVGNSGKKPTNGAVQNSQKQQTPDSLTKAVEYCSIFPNGAYIRDSKDCNKYYVCANGQAISRMCPKSLYFDIQKKICNFANLVDCSKNLEQSLNDLTGSSSSSSGEIHNSEVRENSTKASVESSSSGSPSSPPVESFLDEIIAYFNILDSNEASNSAKNTELNSTIDTKEAVNSTSAVAKTKESNYTSDSLKNSTSMMNSTAYLQDLVIKKEVMKSSDKLSNNSTNKLASNSKVVQKSQNSAQKSGKDISKDSTKTTTKTDKTQNLKQSGNLKGKEEHSIASAHGGKGSDCWGLPNGAFLRDPESCGKFYVCANGHAILRNCPGVLYFDIKKKVCNFPSLVDCAMDKKSTYVDKKSGAKEVNSKYSAECRSAANGDYLRDPNSCNKFYVCVNGQAIHRQCPKGLYIDTKQKYCNFPSFVECPLDAKSVKLPSPIASEAVKPDCTGKSEGSTFRDSKLCNKYYVCLKGTPVVHFCKPGLWFDLKRKVCDQERLVECNN